MIEKFTGSIVRGDGLAHVNFGAMIPLAAPHCPGIEKCGQFGTINIELGRTIDKNRADCWTPTILWKPISGLVKNRLETFGFVRIGLEVSSGVQAHDAWIIIPDGHPSSYRGNRVEVIAEVRIPGVRYGETCAVQLDHTPSVLRPAWFGKGFEQQLNANGRYRDPNGIFMHKP